MGDNMNKNRWGLLNMVREDKNELKLKIFNWIKGIITI